ncbi:hypothetical protein EIP91_010994 [Steccherinum ochraceum]|uniref:F-box domain-containing protein n=1 Tax=Steccherinum ochraceum TaxID=92696 RepID=A0A4R0RLC3_9APHY|nr:hypothetical protein EIP91_010994 [Steccherinum ochraceum]
MHRIFRIPELVNLIIQHLTIRGLEAVENSDWLYDKSKEPYNVLASVALQDIKALGQTSKVFTEACLNEAWLSQIGVAGLLRLVDAVEEIPRDDDTGSKTWKMSRQLTEQDIPILLRHSSRIQELSLSSIHYLEDTEGAAEMLSFDRMVIFFPKLRTLSWHATGTAELNFVMSSIGDDVLTGISATILAPIPSNIMAMVEKRRHHLKTLFLSSAGHSSENSNVGRTVKTVLQDTTSLTELHISDDVGEYINLWDAAAQLPRLTKLTFHDSSPAGGPSSEVTYSRLAVFDLRLATPDVFILAMASVDFTSLQCFEIDFDGSTSTHRPLDILSAVARSCGTCPLRTLSLRVSGLSGITYPPEKILGPESLDVLKQLPLTHLDINMSWSWNLTNDSLRNIALTWRNITVLDLDPTGVWPTPSNVTMDGLELLAYSCPRLRMLGIQFDSTPPEFYRAEDLYRHMQGRSWSETVHMLSVGRSVIDSPKDVALFLSCIFPNLETCLPHLPSEPAHRVVYQRWIRVSEFLPVMGLARRQERWWDEVEQ